MEGAFQANMHVQEGDKGKKKINKYKGAGSNSKRIGNFPLCQHCKKTNHL